jgi:hypothetical protein
MIHITVHPRIQLIRQIAAMMSRISRSSHASRVRAVVSVTVEAGIKFVAHVAGVRASVCATRGGTAVVHVGVVARVEFVAGVGRVRAVV